MTNHGDGEEVRSGQGLEMVVGVGYDYKQMARGRGLWASGSFCKHRCETHLAKEENNGRFC